MNEVLKAEEVDLMVTVGGPGEREVFDVNNMKMVAASIYQA